MALDAYNAQYPLAYYEVGTAYSFYQPKHQGSKPMAATADQVAEFKAALSEAKAKNKFTPESGEWQAFKRAIGVVINKYKTEHMGVLEVMFEDNGEYSVRKYGIEMPPVFFDDKEFVPVHEKKSTGPKFDSATGPKFDSTTGPKVESFTGPKVK